MQRSCQHFSFRPSTHHVHFTRVDIPSELGKRHFSPSILVRHELYSIGSTSRVNGSCLQPCTSSEIWSQSNHNERISLAFDILHYDCFHVKWNFFQVLLDFDACDCDHRIYRILLLCFQLIDRYSSDRIPWYCGCAYRDLLHRSKLHQRDEATKGVQPRENHRC